MAAARHTLILLLERLVGEHRIPREAIYLVLNQVTDRSPISLRGFHDELVSSYASARCLEVKGLAQSKDFLS